MQAFQRAIFDRATAELRSGVVKSAETLVRLATDPNVDDAIALKAAQDVLDRNLGKAPQTLNVSIEAPWEEVFTGIAQVSREESRRLRAIEGTVENSSGPTNPAQEPLEVETVENPSATTKTPTQEVFEEALKGMATWPPTPGREEGPKDEPKKELSDLMKSRDSAMITPVLIAPSFDPDIVPGDFLDELEEAEKEGETIEGLGDSTWIDEVDWDD